jgi:hypothetical protein
MNDKKIEKLNTLMNQFTIKLRLKGFNFNDIGSAYLVYGDDLLDESLKEILVSNYCTAIDNTLDKGYMCND